MVKNNLFLNDFVHCHNLLNTETELVLKYLVNVSIIFLVII